MEDSKPSTFDKFKVLMRWVGLGFGLLFWLVGCVLGILQRFDSGVWFLVLGISLVQASEFGRPVFINIWNQLTGPEEAEHVPGGYL